MIATATPKAAPPEAAAKYAVTCLNAEKGDVRQLFARTTPEGIELGDCEWRCILCHKPSEKSIFRAPQGNQNLIAHAKNRHGIVLVDGVTAPKVKKPKVGPDQKTLASYGSAVDVTATQRASVMLVVKKLLPFSFVTEDFGELLSVMAGHVVKPPSRQTVSRMVADEAKRLRDVMRGFFEQQSTEAGQFRFSLAGDGKKAETLGLPMYDVTIHFSSHHGDRVSLPLDISEIADKTDIGAKRHILQVLTLFNLSPDNMYAFVGDEQEMGVARLLSKYPVACIPHRLSTAFKHGLRDAGMMLSLDAKSETLPDGELSTVGAVKGLIKFASKRYRANQICLAERRKLNLSNNVKETITTLKAFPATRFLCLLSSAESFVLNRPVLQALNRHAVENPREPPFHEWPGLKERYFLEMTDLTFICGPLPRLLELMSGESYATLSRLVPELFKLKSRLWRLAAQAPNAQVVGGLEPPLEPHQWLTPAGPKLARGLYDAVERKFADDLKNPAVLLAAFFDPRFRAFQWPLRDAEMDDETFAAEQRLWASIRTRAIDGKGIETRMMSAAIDLYRFLFPGKFEVEVNGLTEREREWAEGGDFRHLPIWRDLRNWVSFRPENLSIGDAPLTMRVDPLDFWKQCFTFNTIKPMAMVVLAVPASGVSCERLWSAVGTVMTKRRGALLIETGSNQVFVREVWKAAKTALKRKNLSDASRKFFSELMPFAHGSRAARKK